MRAAMVLAVVLVCQFAGEWAQNSDDDDDAVERILAQTRKLTFAQDIYPILVPYLHASKLLASTDRPTDPLLSERATAYMRLVNVPSHADPSMTLVVPGDAEHSFLLAVLANSSKTAGTKVGRKQSPAMNGTPLTSFELAEVKAWITGGAVYMLDENGVAGLPGPNGGLIRGGNVVTPLTSTILATIGTVVVVLASAGYLYIKTQ